MFCFRKYTLGGSYRKIVQVPIDLSWHMTHYNDKYDDLVASDIDEIRERQPIKISDGEVFSINCSTFHVFHSHH